MRIYRGLPLFARILIAAILGALLGHAIGNGAKSFEQIPVLILQCLRLLATPLIFLSIVHSILATDVQGRLVGRLLWVLLSNSLAAILIGLLVSKVLSPGAHVHFPHPTGIVDARPSHALQDLVNRIPKDWVTPFLSNDLIGIILIGVGLALALRTQRNAEHAKRIEETIGYLKLGLDTVMKLLSWLFELIPLAVLAIVANVVGTTGFAPLLNLIWFVAAVVIALLILCGFYMIRLQFSARVKAVLFFTGSFDAFALAFSTASSAATLPVTYECATERLGVKEEWRGKGSSGRHSGNHGGRNVQSRWKRPLPNDGGHLRGTGGRHFANAASTDLAYPDGAYRFRNRRRHSRSWDGHDARGFWRPSPSH